MPSGIYKRTIFHGKQISKAKKGIKPYVMTNKIRIKMSEAHKGKRSNASGKHWRLSNEARKNISKGHKGINIWMKGRIEEKSNNWKGNDIGYNGLHMWVRKKLGQPTKCEHCGRYFTGRKIHWANKDHLYKRNLNDWIRLCRWCHSKYDKINNKNYGNT